MQIDSPGDGDGQKWKTIIIIMNIERVREGRERIVKLCLSVPCRMTRRHDSEEEKGRSRGRGW